MAKSNHVAGDAAFAANPTGWVLMAGQLLIVVPEAAMRAVLMVGLVERFATSLPGTGFGAVWALSVAVIGGPAPLVSTALESHGWAWLFPC